MGLKFLVRDSIILSISSWLRYLVIPWIRNNNIENTKGVPSAAIYTFTYVWKLNSGGFDLLPYENGGQS